MLIELAKSAFQLIPFHKFVDSVLNACHWISPSCSQVCVSLKLLYFLFFFINDWELMISSKLLLKMRIIRVVFFFGYRQKKSLNSLSRVLSGRRKYSYKFIHFIYARTRRRWKIWEQKKTTWSCSWRIFIEWWCVGAIEAFCWSVRW